VKNGVHDFGIDNMKEYLKKNKNLSHVDFVKFVKLLFVKISFLLFLYSLNYILFSDLYHDITCMFD